MNLKKLNFSYPNKAPLFKDFNLALEENKLTTFLGASGCGKSTLLRLFSGLEKVKNDEMDFNKKDLIESFVFQDSSLLNWKTCYENIMLPLLNSKQIIDSEHVNKVIQSLKMQDFLESYPHQISGGQKMRVSIARALIVKPKILYMDEPFAALDEMIRFELQDKLLELQKEFSMTILFVTHSLYEAVYLSDRILFLSNQKPVSILRDLKLEHKVQNRLDPSYQKTVSDLYDYYKKSKVIADV